MGGTFPHPPPPIPWESVTTGQRERQRIRDRLATVQDDLRRARANQRVLQEQVDFLRGVADDAETRKLVAETPLADRDHREAMKDHDNHARLLDEARREIETLEADRDRLLDRLLEEGQTT